MEMLAETMEALDYHVDRLDHVTTNRTQLVELAGGVRRAFEGMHDLLELYNWVDEPPASTYGVTPLMSP